MSDKAIEYFNRYTRRVEREAIYGEGYLRWSYENRLGRLMTHLLVKRAVFSRWYGWRMNRPASRRKIAPFIRRYGLDANEFADSAESFHTFNEFFYRKLKPEKRPITPTSSTAVFPADGRHLGLADLSKAAGFFVKGQCFDLPALLQDSDLAARFAKGSLIFSRLCPVDYHRFHFPVAAVPSRPKILPGARLSVSPVALCRNLSILWTNKRALTQLRETAFGLVLMLEIGATNVGSIQYTFQPDQAVSKGEEKGYFEFGGSALITLFQPGRIQLAPDLLEQTALQRELYAHMGDGMGEQLASV
jgi:phosphatidylserine decarboxylase